MKDLKREVTATLGSLLTLEQRLTSMDREIARAKRQVSK